MGIQTQKAFSFMERADTSNRFSWYRRRA